jgi:hypothetical protein
MQFRQRAAPPISGMHYGLRCSFTAATRIFNDLDVTSVLMTTKRLRNFGVDSIADTVGGEVAGQADREDKTWWLIWLH